MATDEAAHEISITIRASVGLVDPREVLPPLEEGEHPAPPEPESFKLAFRLPGAEEGADPLEMQCGTDIVHTQPVNEGYIESLVNEPASFTLLQEDGEAVGEYKVSLASWAMGTPKAVRETLDDIDRRLQDADAVEVTEDYTEEAKEVTLAALRDERSAVLAPSNVDFKWELSEYELQVLLRCHCESNVARLPKCPALQRVSISLSLSNPMMTQQLEQKLNPLAITLIDATNLPSKPLNYRQLMERCVDPYAEYTLLGKSVRTFPQKHQQNLVWNFTSVFFVGLRDQAELIRSLEAEPLKIYLHDRDPKELQLVTDEELREMGCYDWYYAKKAAKGCDPNAPAPSGPVGSITVDLSPLADEKERAELTFPALYKRTEACQERKLYVRGSPKEPEPAGAGEEQDAEEEGVKEEEEGECLPGGSVCVLGREGDWLRVLHGDEEVLRRMSAYQMWNGIAEGTHRFRDAAGDTEIAGSAWVRAEQDGVALLEPVMVPRNVLRVDQGVVPCTPSQEKYDTDRYEKPCPPGHLIDAHTSMRVSVNLLHQLHRQEPKKGEFQRAVYRMDYTEHTTLRKILAAVTAVNARQAGRALLESAAGRARAKISAVLASGRESLEGVIGECPEGLKSAAAAVWGGLEGEGGLDELSAAVQALQEACAASQVVPEPPEGEEPQEAPHAEAAGAVLAWLESLHPEVALWADENQLAREDTLTLAPAQIRELPEYETALQAAFGEEYALYTTPPAAPEQPAAAEEAGSPPGSPTLEETVKVSEGGEEAAAAEEAAAEAPAVEPQTPRAVLYTQAHGDGIAQELTASAAAAIEAFGGPKEEVGLAELAEKIVAIRTVATQHAVSRSELSAVLGVQKVETPAEEGAEEGTPPTVVPGTGLWGVMDGLEEAASRAGVLKDQKEAAANFDHADQHLRQEKAAKVALSELAELQSQMEAAAFIEAAAAVSGLEAAGHAEEASEIAGMRTLLEGIPSRQQLQDAAPRCRALAGGLRAKGADEEACSAVERLAGQLRSDSRSAPVALTDDQDFVSGFQVTDGEVRVLMLEGLHAGALDKLVIPVARKAQAGELLPYTLLFNNKVSFKSRLFAPFAHDIRNNSGVEKYRLDGGDAFGGVASLSQLLLSKALYYRGDPKVQGRLKFGMPPPAEVNLEGYKTMNLIAELNRQTRMWDVAALSLFPTVPELKSLEDSFCMPKLSREDCIGPEPAAPVPSTNTLLGGSGRRRSVQLPDGTLQTVDLGDTSWHRNPEFEQSLAARKGAPAKDFLQSNVQAVEPLTAPLPVDKWWEHTDAVFPYSGQRLQYTELQKEEIRQRAAKDKEKHYTYSLTYLSGSLCPVNEAEIAQAEAALSKSLCMTEKGFVYPAPKEPEDFIKHPWSVSESRSEDLKAPFEQPIGMGPSGREVPVKEAELPSSLRGRPAFDATACANRVFEKDPLNAWRSVHLETENREYQHENKEALMKQWRQKIVVDNAQVQVYRQGVQRARVAQVDRMEGTLKGPARKKALASMPHPVQKLPASISCEEPFPEKYAPGTIKREYDPNKWQSPDDFILSINSKYKPYKQKQVHGEKKGGLLQVKHGGHRIEPLKATERVGAAWGQTRH